MPFTNKPFTTEDKIKMFERMGSTSAVIALALVILIETGLAGENKVELRGEGKRGGAIGTSGCRQGTSGRGGR